MGDETLAIVPASAGPAVLDDALAVFDRTVVLKPSMAPDLGARLRDLGLLERSALVVEASGPGQRVLRGDGAHGRAPYFSAWLIDARGGRGDGGRVHFVGAGPGAAEHLTRRALSLVRRADLLVAADSLVAPEVIAMARSAVVPSAGLALEETMPAIVDAARRGEVVVRLHSGDPSLYGTLDEQMALLREAELPYEVVPGVSSLFAATAALGVGLTQAGGSQSVVLTRHGRRVPAPERERLRDLAAHGTSLAIFLSATDAGDVERELLDAGLDPDTPAAVCYRVSWPDELVARTTVGELGETVRARRLRRHTLILVGEALVPGGRRSRLYDSGHAHVHRRRGSASRPELDGEPALVATTPAGVRLARRLARATSGVRLVVADELASDGDERLGEAAATVPALAAACPLVLFAPVDAAVRLLARAADGRSVVAVAVDEGGRFAVPLLGARSGANRLAEWVAAVLATPQAVVTTAAEGLDGAIREAGWRLVEPGSLAGLEAALASGTPVGFFGPGLRPPAGFDLRVMAAPAAMTRHTCGLAVTDRDMDVPAGWALARPRRLVVGVAASAGAPADVEAAALAALRAAGLAPDGVGVVAGDHAAVAALAARLGARAFAVPDAAAAEAALAGADGGRVVAPGASVAIAEAPA
jgi:precorrin-4 C11-methyltransferase